MSDRHFLEQVEEHAAWIDRITPYLDKELDAAASEEVRQHIAVCPLCERESTRQRLLAERLRLLADPAVLAQQAEQIQQRVLNTLHYRRKHGKPGHAWVTPLGWLLALAQAVVLMIVLFMPSPKVEHVPMVEEAYADYQHASAGDFPFQMNGSAALAALPLPVEPLKNAKARLIGSWQTRLRGEPAAVLAYRVSDHIVLQYVVSERLFFTPPRVREAVSKTGLYVSKKRRSTIVAWPGRQSGSLLIGDLPSNELIQLVTSS